MGVDAQWFRDAKYGVMIHYLCPNEEKDMSAEDWNKRVDSFDEKLFADCLEESGARFCFFAVGQNSGHYCSPNEAYDEIVGLKPSKCSKRDLIKDVASELEKRGIRLMVYTTGNAPFFDDTAMERLEWKRGEHRLINFQRKWEKILGTWSKQWGNKVHGWWVDGCYSESDYMRDRADEPNYNSFARALRSGNENALVAFNGGFVFKAFDCEDFTAGEMSDHLTVSIWDDENHAGLKPIGDINGKIFQVFSFLGDWWMGRDPERKPRFPDDLVHAYTKYVVSHGGVVTWDVPFEWNGEIPKQFVRQLKQLKDI